MADLTDLASGLVPGAPRLSVPFAAFLLLHVPAGLTSVVTGAMAAVSRKRRGRHPRFGTIYFWALSVVFVSMTALSVMHWPQDEYLLILGSISFAVAGMGYSARRVRWPGWTSFHVVGMSSSYIVLLTAFYVDNGPHLPLLNRLPVIVFWIVPSLVGVPLIVRALVRHTRPLADIRATAARVGSAWSRPTTAGRRPR